MFHHSQVKASFFSFAESVYSSLKTYVSKSDSVKQMWTHCYEKIELFRIWRCGICYRYTLHSCPAVTDNSFKTKPYKVFHSFIMKGVGSTIRKITIKFKEHPRSSRYYTMDDCIISNSITLKLSTITAPLF